MTALYDRCCEGRRSHTISALYSRNIAVGCMDRRHARHWNDISLSECRDIYLRVISRAKLSKHASRRS